MASKKWPPDYFGLKLVNHGGKCCGKKTIYGFNLSPYHPWYCSAIGETSMNNADKYGNVVSCNDRFFHWSAPQESYLERLKRYIRYVEHYRPKHLIEVTINKHQIAWKPVLEELGFKQVNEWVNSNTNCTIYELHLVLDGTPCRKDAPAPWAEVTDG